MACHVRRTGPANRSQLAADAGASGINTPAYRASDHAVLDPSQAVVLAQANLNQQANLPPLAAAPDISVTPEQITVTLRENVHLTLLGILEGNHPIHITASGSSAPRPSGAP